VKDARPSPAILLHQERGGRQSRLALASPKKRSRVNGLFSLGRMPAISDNIASQNLRLSGKNEPMEESQTTGTAPGE
jgi:hypothetical protein